MIIFILILFAVVMLLGFGPLNSSVRSRLSQLILMVTFILVAVSPMFYQWGYQVTFHIMNFEKVHLIISLAFDPLTWVMLLSTYFIGTIIHSYATRYLQSDSNQNRFLAQMQLLIAAVTLLICSGNLLTAFIAWQFIGLSLYLLLNHFHYDPKANKAAKKEFIINRVGDISFLFAVILMYQLYGTTDFQSLMKISDTVSAVPLILVFVAVMTKSAQFPFHIWLIDTMETPTPVSAMMHAGVINAGGFLLARLAFLYSQHAGVLMLIVIIGLTTAFLGHFFKRYQADVKKQLAYSTMGQMGYMVAQCGLGCFSSAVYHLISHGLFKAYLFLSSGNLTQDMKRSEPVSYFSNPRTLAVSLMLTVALLFIGKFSYGYFNLELDLNPLIWLFSAITLFQLLSNNLNSTLNIKLKLMSFGVIAFVYFVYLYFLHVTIVTLAIPSSFSLLVFVTAVILAMMFIVLTTASAKRFSIIGFNKLSIERIYRKYLINQLRSMGDFLVAIYVKKTIKTRRFINLIFIVPQLVILFTLLFFQFESLPLLKNVLIVLELFLLIILGIAANRTESLKGLSYLLILTTVSFTILTLSFETKTMNLLGGYYLINASVVLIGIYHLLFKRKINDNNVQLYRENKLPWCHFYMAALFMLFIGIPGTSSFISELFLFSELLQTHWLFSFVAGAYMILLTLIILHTLQQSIFSTKAIRENVIQLSRGDHAVYMIIIAFNLMSGIFPGVLLKTLTLLT